MKMLMVEVECYGRICGDCSGIEHETEMCRVFMEHPKASPETSPNGPAWLPFHRLPACLRAERLASAYERLRKGADDGNTVEVVAALADIDAIEKAKP